MTDDKYKKLYYEEKVKFLNYYLDTEQSKDREFIKGAIVGFLIGIIATIIICG